MDEIEDLQYFALSPRNDLLVHLASGEERAAKMAEEFPAYIFFAVELAAPKEV